MNNDNNEITYKGGGGVYAFNIFLIVYPKNILLC